jgi:hypothetical protein
VAPLFMIGSSLIRSFGKIKGKLKLYNFSTQYFSISSLDYHGNQVRKFITILNLSKNSFTHRSRNKILDCRQEL